MIKFEIRMNEHLKIYIGDHPIMNINNEWICI